jgi:AraC-like DNA-binding protein
MPHKSDINPAFISSQVSESDYFFLDLTPDPNQPFTVACGGLEYCTQNYRISRKQFNYYGMEYIVSGMCELVLGNENYPLKAGSIFCYGPQTPHKIANSSDVPLVKFFVDFTGSSVRKHLGELFLRSRRPYQMPNLRVMHEMFYQILETGKAGGRNVQEILQQIILLIAAQVKDKAVHLNEYSSQSYITYERCLAIIQQNYREMKSIARLAEECHISTGYLSRIFKKYAGESPSEILTRLKLNRAGELLLQDNLLIKEISDEVGYEDPYHFSRLFKQHYGMSPKHFRESVKRF